MSVDIWRAKEVPVKAVDSLKEENAEKLPKVERDKKRIQRLKKALIRHNAMREGIPLKYFKEVLAAYVLPVVRKGVPSLYANLKPLTACAWKREVS